MSVAGRGDCGCETDECMCTALEETTGLPYGGDLCECNPIICYNPRNQEVSYSVQLHTRECQHNDNDIIMIVCSIK